MSEISENNPNCPCKRIKCKNYGNCIACKEKHHNRDKVMDTACEKAAKRAAAREARAIKRGKAEK